MPRAWWIITLPVFLAFLALSVLLSVYFHQLFLLLVLPFVPFLFRWGTKSPPDSTPTLRACPRCDWSTTDPQGRFCPRDGERLLDAPQRF